MVVERKCVTVSPNVNHKSRKLQKERFSFVTNLLEKKSAIGFFSFFFLIKKCCYRGQFYHQHQEYKTN